MTGTNVTNLLGYRACYFENGVKKYSPTFKNIAQAKGWVKVQLAAFPNATTQYLVVEVKK